MTLQANGAPGTRLHSITTGTGGEPVVCLHSSAGSSGQWRRLTEVAPPDFRFIAVDFHGHGRSGAYAGSDYSLETESDAVLRLLPTVGPVHLVGHSFGGAVALHLAVNHPHRFASVAVYEPVLFRLLDRSAPEFMEISSVGLSIVQAARVGATARAAATFIEYWNGAGAWNRLPAEQQERVEGRIDAVARHFEALFADPLPWTSLSSLRIPALVLTGDASPAPAQAIAHGLAALPAVVVEVLAGLSHMGPVTHADQVNARLLQHLAGHAAPRLANAA